MGVITEVCGESRDDFSKESDELERIFDESEPDHLDSLRRNTINMLKSQQEKKVQEQEPIDGDILSFSKFGLPTQKSQSGAILQKTGGMV